MTGGMAIVVATQPLVLRSAPGTGSDSVILDERLHPSMTVRVLEGPIPASGYDWYRVQVGVLSGWAAEASRDGEPWLVPFRNGAIAFGGASEGQQRKQVISVQADGSQRRVLTELPAAPAASTQTGRPPVVFAVAGNQQPDEPHAASPVCYADTFPAAWSPDGGTLLFVDGCIPSAPTLYAIAAEGGPAVQIGPEHLLQWRPREAGQVRSRSPRRHFAG
jgi:hypothetical protein